MLYQIGLAGARFVRINEVDEKPLIDFRDSGIKETSAVIHEPIVPTDAAPCPRVGRVVRLSLPELEVEFEGQAKHDALSEVIQYDAQVMTEVLNPIITHLNRFSGF